MGALFSVNLAVLNYNLHGGPLNIVPALAVVFIAAIAVTAIALVASAASNCRAMLMLVEAEEVHGSAAVGVGFYRAYRGRSWA